MAAQKTSGIQRYGLTFPSGTTDAEIELICFNHDWPEEKGGLGRYGHFVRATDLLLNKKGKLIIWNEWSELMFREFCNNRETIVAGPSASWKSTCAAWYGLICAISSPADTKVIITSTSIGGLRERIWKDMLKFFRYLDMNFGNIINHPTPKIQVIKGDDSCGIFGVAVEQGDIDKAIDKIKGRHAPNVIVIIDEATGAQQAIVDACLNLSTGCTRFQLIAIANPASYFDEHGKLAEPENGWNSVSVNDEKWKTKRGGVCVHLDGLKSPNVLAGYQKYPGMVGSPDLEQAAKVYGENSPKFWQERRGFWAPEGITKTVLSATMIEKFRGRQVVPGEGGSWESEPILGAALDPAFEGGDRRILRFAKCGMVNSGKKEWSPSVDFKPFKESEDSHFVICFTEVLNLKVDVTSKEPIHYQIARQTREECKTRGVDSRHFAMDSSGEGGGVASIFKREWASDFVEVEFGGGASDRPVSEINPHLGREEYTNRVSELWYQFRYALEQNQIRGLDIETCNEFCTREYEMHGNRICVLSKSKMKGLKGHSPDLADAAVVMLELFRTKIKDFSVTSDSAPVNDTRWKEFQRKFDATPREEELYSEVSLDA